MPVARTKSTKSSGKRKAVKARDFALDAKELKIRQGVRGKYVQKYNDWMGLKTYHSGANDERTAILAKVRRMQQSAGDFDTSYEKLTELVTWLLSRNERYKKNPGGL